MGIGDYRGVAGGILRVAEIIADHRQAVVRDLNDMGYRGRSSVIDIEDLVSIVLASPPNSAVRYFVEGGWSQTDQLLANISEQQANLTSIPQRYGRPGVADPIDPGPVTPTGGARFTPQTREEFAARRARDIAAGAKLAASETRVA